MKRKEPIVTMEKVDAKIEIELALQQLPERERGIVRAYYLLGRPTVAEVAASAGIGRSQAARALDRGKVALRRFMGRLG